MPQVMGTRVGDMVAFGQVRTYRFDQLAPALTDAAQWGRKAYFHVCAWGCEQFTPLLLSQFVLTKVVNEPFVCQENTLELFNQIVEQFDLPPNNWSSNMLELGCSKGNDGQQETFVGEGDQQIRRG